MQLFSYQTMSLVRDYCVKCKLTRDYCVKCKLMKKCETRNPSLYSLLLIIDFYIIHVTKNDL